MSAEYQDHDLLAIVAAIIFAGAHNADGVPQASLTDSITVADELIAAARNLKAVR